MHRPALQENQFAVGQAELATGHVLQKDGSLYISGSDITNVYEIFNSYEAAQKFAITKVKNDPKVECWIINFLGKTLFVYDTEGERKFKDS